MQATFFKVNKRRNSTLVPYSNPNIVKDTALSSIKIIDNKSSLLDMKIKLLDKMHHGGVIQQATKYNSFYYNYCVIAEFHRCYYVDNWEIGSDGFFTCSLHCDVLATFHSNILAGEGFIERTSNSRYYSNRLWSDNFYPGTLDRIQLKNSNTQATSPFSSNPSNGIVIMTSTSSVSGSGDIGTADYNYMTQAQFAILCNNMSNVVPGAAQGTYTSMDTLQRILQNTLKAVGNPLEYIHQLQWFPIETDSLPSATFSNSARDIHLGGWNTGATGRAILKTDFTLSPIVLQIPRDNSNNASTPETTVPIYPPFAKYWCYNPLIGVIELDPVALSSNFSMYIAFYFTINLVSGNARLEIYYSPMNDFTENVSLKKLMLTREFKISMDIPVALNGGINQVKVAQDVIGNVGVGVQYPIYTPRHTDTAGIYDFREGNKVIGGLRLNWPDVPKHFADSLFDFISRGQSNGEKGNGFFADIWKFTIYADYRVRSTPNVKIFGVPTNEYSTFADINAYQLTPRKTKMTYLKAQYVYIPRICTQYGTDDLFAMTDDEYNEITTLINTGIYIESPGDTPDPSE